MTVMPLSRHRRTTVGASPAARWTPRPGHRALRDLEAARGPAGHQAVAARPIDRLKVLSGWARRPPGRCGRRTALSNRQQVTTSAHPSGRDTARLALVVGALGVVFGDIGTSPIYTLQTVFNPDDPHPVPVSTENVFGVV